MLFGYRAGEAIATSRRHDNAVDAVGDAIGQIPADCAPRGCANYVERQDMRRPKSRTL